MSQPDVGGTAARALSYTETALEERIDAELSVDAIRERADHLVCQSFVQQHVEAIGNRLGVTADQIPWYAEPVLAAVYSESDPKQLGTINQMVMGRALDTVDHPRDIAQRVGGDVTQEKVRVLCSHVLGYEHGVAGLYKAAQHYRARWLGHTAVHVLTGEHMDLERQARCPIPEMRHLPRRRGNIARESESPPYDAPSYHAVPMDVHAEEYRKGDKKPSTDIPLEPLTEGEIKQFIKDVVRGVARGEAPEWWGTSSPRPSTKKERKKLLRAPGRKKLPRLLRKKGKK